MQRTFFRAMSCSLVALTLAGCAGHTVYLVGRTTGVTAQSKFRIVRGGDVSFKLRDEVYSGRWVYVEGGGSIGVGTATSFSGTQSVTTTGTVVGLPTGGTGSFLGASPSGATLRCSFNFSEWNLKGLGACQDSKGEAYDLQID